MARFRCKKVSLYLNGKKVFDSRGILFSVGTIKKLELYIDSEPEPCFYLGGPVKPSS